MKICEIVEIDEAKIPGVDLITKGIAKMVKPSEKTLAKRAEKAAKQQQAQVSRAIVSQEWNVFKERINPWISAGIFTGTVVTPLWDYYQAVTAAENKLKAGTYTEENYNYVRQMEASKLVTALTVGITATLTLSFFRGFLTLTKRVPIFGTFLSPLASFLQGLDRSAQVAFVAFLNTETGRKWLAVLATFTIFEGTPYEISMPNIAGNLGVWLIDKAKSAVGMEVPGTPASTAKTPAAGQAGAQAEPFSQEFKPTTKRDFYTGKLL